MRHACLVLITFVSLSAYCQNHTTIARQESVCPVEGLKITPRVYSFRIYNAGGEGWFPDSKMAIDLRLKNKGDRGIAVATFEVTAHSTPHDHIGYGNIIADYGPITLNVQPNEERQLYFAQRNLIDLSSTSSKNGWISVLVTQLRYSDGEIVSLYGCYLGDAQIPPPFKPVKPTSPSEIFEPASDIAPPRILEEHLPVDEHTEWPAQPISVLLSFVIEIDGSPQDIKVDSSSGDAALDKKAVDTLRTWNFAPAMKNDQPVATRNKLEFKWNFPNFSYKIN